MFIMMILLTKDALASGLMTLMTTNQDPSTFTPLSHLLLDNLDLEGLEQVLHLVIFLFFGGNYHHCLLCHYHQEGNLGRAGEGLREEFLELLQVSC